jgi:concanavalin A-like lectin/glucanase superfamily protein
MRRTGGRSRTIAVLAVAAAFIAIVSPPAIAQTAYRYAMDETSGTVMTAWGGAPDGAISGDVDLGVPGVRGTAYGFNRNVGSCDSSWNVTGTGSVVIAPASAFDVGSKPFRFSAWLKTRAVPGVDSGASADCDFDVWRRAARWRLELVPPSTSKSYGTPLCSWKGVLNGKTAYVSLKGTVNVTDGRWHKVTCRRNRNGEQLLIDQTVVERSTRHVGSIQTNAKVYVGTQRAGADYYEGRLDELSFAIG